MLSKEEMIVEVSQSLLNQGIFQLAEHVVERRNDSRSVAIPFESGHLSTFRRRAKEQFQTQKVSQSLLNQGIFQRYVA